MYRPLKNPGGAQAWARWELNSLQVSVAWPDEGQRRSHLLIQCRVLTPTVGKSALGQPVMREIVVFPALGVLTYQLRDTNKKTVTGHIKPLQ
jgi:hypothetical protein